MVPIIDRECIRNGYYKREGIVNDMLFLFVCFQWEGVIGVLQQFQSVLNHPKSSFLILYSVTHLMQNPIRTSHTAISTSETIVDDIISQDPERRNHAAILYRKWIERMYHNADAQEYTTITDEIYTLFSHLSKSNADHVRLGFLAVMDQLIDLGYDEERRNVRISHELNEMSRSIHTPVLFKPFSSVSLRVRIHQVDSWPFAPCQ